MKKPKGVAVIMAFVCNPYTAAMQKRTYDRYWKSEVDEVYISVNDRNDRIRKFIVDLWQKDDKVRAVNDCNEKKSPGCAWNDAYSLLEGGNEILMLEDSDNFIYQEGVVARFRDKILNDGIDSIGSSGYHGWPAEFSDLAIEKHGTVRMNTFIVMFRQSILDQLGDKADFATCHFKKGTKFGDIVAPCDGSMDTMGKLSLEFFGLSDKKEFIPHTAPGQYVHLFAVDNIYRRLFDSLVTSNDQKWIPTTIWNAHPAKFLVNLYMLYEEVKGDIPFPDYNQEFEKGLEHEIKRTGATLSEIQLLAKEFKHNHKGLFQ